ncbi:MAG TPA: hypothetical protein VF426_00185, partial [Marmoricola sp.]
DVARSAVRDAYVAAYHHWRKVGRMSDPESWVRPQAWGRAHRRARVRPGHREKGLSPEQGQVLAGLAGLTDTQRRTLLLTHLAALPMDAIGRELGIPRPEVEHQLQQGTVQFALAVDCESTTVRPRLESLAPIVTSPGLPRVTTIRRNGVRRRRWHALGGAVVVLALAIGSGWIVSTHSPALSAGARRALEHPVTAGMLLGPHDLTPLAASGWHTTSTSGNTSGSGLHSPCQAHRFADDRGLGAWVRTFAGPRERQVVQSVEVSASPGATAATYDRTVHWYAGCTQAQAHLDDSYRVRGLGDDAVALDLTVHGGDRYLITIARSGETTQTTLLHTAVTHDRIGDVTRVAAAAMRGICRSGAVSHCHAGPVRAKHALLPSGEAPGMLATVDLPLLASVSSPWVGTDATTGTDNPAATPCDHTKFTGSGRTPQTRSFVIPGASLPTQFGVTETYAAFADAKSAAAFADGIGHQMQTCEHRNLGSTVSDPFTATGVSGWRVTSEIDAKRTKVTYWMGVVRVRTLVAQVGFTPTTKVDLSRAEFDALVVRARDRLKILSRSAT